MNSMWNKVKKNLSQLTSYTNSLGKKRVVILLLIICIPSLLIGAVIYFVGVNRLKQEMIDTHEEQIINQVEYIDSQLQNLEMSLNYLSFERHFRSGLETINFQEEYQLTEQIAGTIFSKQYSSSLIERMNVFVDAERPSVFNPQFRWVRDEQASEFRRYLTAADDFYWDRNLLQSEEEPHIFPLVLVRNLPAYYSLNSQSSVSFIVELNNEAVLQMIDGLSLSSDGFSFIIDERTGMMITSTASSSRFFEEALINEGMNGESYTTTWNGEEYSVSSGTISRVNTNWTYMSAVPISFITQPVQDLSQIIITTSLIGIFLSLVLANVTFRSFYSPFSKIAELIKGEEGSTENAIDLLQNNWLLLNNERDTLEHNVTQLNGKLISNFFFQLIEGFLATDSEEQLQEKITQYGLNLENKKLCFIDIEVKNKRQKNMVLEHLETDIFTEHYLIQFNQRFFGIVFVFENETLIKKQITRLYHLVKSDKRLDVVVFHASQIVQELTVLYQAVEQIRQKKFKSQTYEETSLVWLPENGSEMLQEVSNIYPFVIEQEILQMIEFGNTSKLTQAIDHFVDELVEQDERTIQYGFVQLYGTIQSQILKDGFYPYELFKGRNILKEIMHNYDIQEMKTILVDDVIKPYLEAKESKKVSEQEYCVKETIKYIHQNYMEDISLEECADEMNVNSYTLSKWFKQEEGVNFIEYLTNYRMEQARKLLVETNEKIGDIAEAVGYQNSYFNRIFKKKFKKTPGHYRKEHQKLDRSVLLK